MLILWRKTRSIVLLALLSILAVKAQAQTATLTGTLTNATSSGVGSNAYLKVDLYGCGGNRPTWSGGVIVSPAYYATDANGVIKAADGTSAATIIRNDAITCGNTTGSTTYYMQPFLDGQPAGNRLQFRVGPDNINAGNFSYNSATSLSVTPATTSPTGDAVYWKLDGSNMPANGNSSTLYGMASNLSATALANQNSPKWEMCGNYWNGAGSSQDCFLWQLVFGTGANPTSSLVLSHSGSPGVAAFDLSGVNFALSNINGILYVDGVTYTTIAAAYAALPSGGCVEVPPNYTETFASNLVLNKSNTCIHFNGPANITLGAFIVSVPSGTNNVSMLSPFAHSSNQGGANLGVSFQAYTGTAAAIDVGDSSGFTYNFLMQGINVGLGSAGVNAIAIRHTNCVLCVFRDDGMVGGAVSGQIGMRTVGTGAFFDGIIKVEGYECNYSASSSNGKCIQAGPISNGIKVVGGHANMGGGANGSVCLDAQGPSQSGLWPDDFDCEVAQTVYTVESTSEGAINGSIRHDSGAVNCCTLAANTNGNKVEFVNGAMPGAITDNGVAGTNSNIRPRANSIRTDKWQLFESATALFWIDVADPSTRLVFAPGAGGDTRLNGGSTTGQVKLAWDQGTGGIAVGNGAGLQVALVDSTGKASFKSISVNGGSTLTAETGSGPNLVTSTGPTIGGGATINGGLTMDTALTVPNGGTGRTTLTNHGVLVGGAASAITQLTAAGANTFLAGVAGADPAFRAPVLASADFANQGSTTTLLHGNAAGNPSFAGVSLVNDTTANQGTTITVLHGNAAGQPSFTVVTPSDAAGNTSGTGNFALITSPAFTTPNIGAATFTTLSSSSNCASSASPAACGSAPEGAFVIAAAATTVTVNTTAVTANSNIIIQEDESLGTRLGVTCNTNFLAAPPAVTARSAGTSFTVGISLALAANPGCFTYRIGN